MSEGCKWPCEISKQFSGTRHCNTCGERMNDTRSTPSPDRFHNQRRTQRTTHTHTLQRPGGLASRAPAIASFYFAVVTHMDTAGTRLPLFFPNFLQNDEHEKKKRDKVNFYEKGKCLHRIFIGSFAILVSRRKLYQQPRPVKIFCSVSFFASHPVAGKREPFWLSLTRSFLQFFLPFVNPGQC